MTRNIVYREVLQHDNYHLEPPMTVLPDVTDVALPNDEPAPSRDISRSDVVLPIDTPADFTRNDVALPSDQATPMRDIIRECNHTYINYLRQKTIQRSYLETSQGRLSGSINGCTVIATLCVSMHLETHGGITNNQINKIIDNDCVSLLKELRQQHGLPEYSGIMMSDVFDYFLEIRLLFQYKFLGGTGGNILNPQHLNNLIMLLQGEEGITSHLKAAAVFYFRQHVISILKCSVDTYDVVESMGIFDFEKGSRTRCFGLDALHIHLCHYCFTHFSNENISFIDTNPWEEGRINYLTDPRFFQGFVWADLPYNAVFDM